MNLLTRLMHKVGTLQSKTDPYSPKASIPTQNWKLDLDNLTPWQDGFCRWSAQRLGISLAESKQRYAESWERLEGGHIGPLYRDFTDQAHNIFKVFFDDSNAEVYSAYRHHSYMHMLRMLTYRVPKWNEKNPVIQSLEDYDEF
jgi:hypothetical protein